MKPYMMLYWFGMLLIVLGALMAMFPKSPEPQGESATRTMILKTSDGKLFEVEILRKPVPVITPDVVEEIQYEEEGQ